MSQSFQYYSSTDGETQCQQPAERLTGSNFWQVNQCSSRISLPTTSTVQQQALSRLCGALTVVTSFIVTHKRVESRRGGKCSVVGLKAKSSRTLMKMSKLHIFCLAPQEGNEINFQGTFEWQKHYVDIDLEGLGLYMKGCLRFYIQGLFLFRLSINNGKAVFKRLSYDRNNMYQSQVHECRYSIIPLFPLFRYSPCGFFFLHSATFNNKMVSTRCSYLPLLRGKGDNRYIAQHCGNLLERTKENLLLGIL